MPQESEKFIFNVTVKGGKTHVFGATDNRDLKTWLKFLEVLLSVHLVKILII